MQTRICEKKQITIHYISYYRDLEFRHFWKPFIKIVHEGIQLNTEIDYYCNRIKKNVTTNDVTTLNKMPSASK